ncbi:MAG: M20 family metallopeptidase [Candidatus Geothermarchaeales archaeon]
MSMFQSAEKYLKSLSEEAFGGLCSELVRSISINPPGDTSAVANRIVKFLVNHEIRHEVVEAVKGKVNVLARVGSGDVKLTFNGHIDTVPPGDEEKWDYSPFSGLIRDGYVHGRGSADMKGGVTALLYTAAALKRIEDQLNHSFLFSFVCDEETGGKDGTKYLIENSLLEGEACVIAEPSHYKLFWSVVCGDRGILRLKTKVYGLAAHGSRPVFGVNAILRAMERIEETLKLENKRVRTPNDAKTIIESSKKAFERLTSLDPKYGELKKYMDHYTVNVGTISGGVKVNVVPDECRAEIDIRIPIGGSADSLLKDVKKIWGEGELEYSIISPSYTSPDKKLVEAVSRSLMEEGEDFSIICMPATTDAVEMRMRLGMEVISFGPGELGASHSVNERVSLQQIKRSAEIYMKTARNYV